MTKITFTVPEIFSYALAILAGIVVLKAGLVLALFSGLLVYSLIHLFAPLIESRSNFFRARIFILFIISAFIISGLTAIIVGAIAFTKSDLGSWEALIQSLSKLIETHRPQFPAWLSPYIPNGSDALHKSIAGWLTEHITEAKLWGQEAGYSVIHLFMGMIIGGLIAIHDIHPKLPEFPSTLLKRISNLHAAFQRIVFAQVRISAINTLLSGIYLLGVLPMLGIHLPFGKTMVLITFIAGLLPVIGNVISNTVVVTVSLSHSLDIALISLLYMVVIHKLEYFLNAKIIGIHINAAAWELLTAMLVMEAFFGIPGLVAAPVFYAWLKIELGMGHDLSHSKQPSL